VRILLVSFYFAPYNAVGALRPTRLAEQLERLGSTVHVLSAAPQAYPEGLSCTLESDRIVRTNWLNVNAPVDFLIGRKRVAAHGYAGQVKTGGIVSSLGSIYRAVLHVPDAQVGWRAYAVREGRKLLARAGPFDLIYASAPPFTGLRVAADLASEFGLPWIAELRDLWTDNHNYRHGALRRRLDRAMESKTLHTASALITVSEPLARELRRTFAGLVEVVRNGFDIEESRGIAPYRPDGAFGIVYTGTYYPSYDIKPLLIALEALGDRAAGIRIRFYGRNHDSLKQEVRQSPYESRFQFAGMLPHDRAIAMQKGADALLFFGWNGRPSGGILTSKLYEYLGARRPVLALTDEYSDTGQMILSSGSGIATFDHARIAAWLAERLDEHEASGASPDLPLEDVSQYSRLQQAEHLDRLLQALVPGKRSEV
jgi:hypothetical protein